MRQSLKRPSVVYQLIGIRGSPRDIIKSRYCTKWKNNRLIESDHKESFLNDFNTFFPVKCASRKVILQGEAKICLITELIIIKKDKTLKQIHQ